MAKIDQDTANRVIAASYAAAAEFLQNAAKEMAEAATAAEAGENNLAVGTALGAEIGVDKAKALLDAVKAIRATA